MGENQYGEYTVGLRREFHRHPETAGREEWTIARIAAELSRLSIEYKTVGGSGVLAQIEGSGPGKTVALRADIDALPVQEDPENLARKRDVISQTPGAGHLCGHDAHMAMLLTSARILNERKADLSGRVLLCFERGEEIGLGVRGMVKSLTEERADAVWGIHMHPGIPSGKISVQAGPRMSGDTIFTVTIRGKGGHGSRPDHIFDPIQCSAAMLQTFSSVIPRGVSPFSTASMSVGKIAGGQTANVIPDEVVFSGTIRFFDPKVEQRCKKLMETAAKGVSEAYGCTAGLDFREQALPVVNDGAMSNLAENAVRRKLGESFLLRTEPSMASDTFSYYLQQIPGVYAFLGTKNEALGTGAVLHNTKFDLDESVLTFGVAATVGFAEDFLSGRPAGNAE